MNTSLINIKNTVNTIKKWIVSSILICSTFGLLYQVGSIYQYQQKKNNYSKVVDPNNIWIAIKKGWLITLVNIIVFIIIFINVKYIYILGYSKLFTYVLLLANFIIIFELILANLFFSMYAEKKSKFLDTIKKSLIISNLNIGLSLLMLFLALIIFSCIIVSPFSAYILVPVYLMCLQRVYSKLEEKYQIQNEDEGSESD